MHLSGGEGRFQFIYFNIVAFKLPISYLLPHKN